ncbi:MAG: response regulator transcription factor [Bacteroidales bacterium]
MNKERKIRLMLVDDHQLMLDGLKSLLGEHEDFDILGGAASAEDALKQLRNKDVDVLLADIHLPGMSGIELAAKVTADFPQIKVLALTMHNESSLINRMIAAGAWGYVIKSNNISELVEAIRTVASGKKYLSREVQSIIMGSIYRPDDPGKEFQPNVARLTQREAEILSLIARELSNKKIADKLFISERTVETHRKNIFTKTKTKSVVGLIRYAMENGLLKE